MQTFLPNYQQLTFVLRFEFLAFNFATAVNHMISKAKEENRSQQVCFGRSVAVSAAVLFLAMWQYTSVTHFPALFLNSCGRSQFELVLLYMANVCVGYRLNLALGESSSARSLNCKGLTRVSPACCGNSRSDVFRPSRWFIP